MNALCNSWRRCRCLALPTIIALIIGLMTPGIASAKFGMKDTVGDNDIKLQVYGFSQLEMRGGDGASSEGGPFFQAQRIRVGFNYFQGNNAGKLFLDFNQSFTDKSGNLAKVIKDAFVAHKFSDSAFIRMGMIKTPVGMGFTVPGWNLDIIERSGLDKGLVLERDFGLMLSGRLIGQAGYEGKKQMKCNGLEMGAERQGYGFGYDLGVFNPAGRSKAVAWDSDLLGDALAYAGRVHYDYGPALHMEASYGVSQQAGGAYDPLTMTSESEDYSVMDFGIATMLWDKGIELKAEYVAGSNVKGVDGYDQTCLTGTVGYYVTENFELVGKTCQASAEKGAYDLSLGNTYIGFVWSPDNMSAKWRDLQRYKIVVNYIIASGDTDDWNSSVTKTGVGGYTDNCWGIQWQYKF